MRGSYVFILVLIAAAVCEGNDAEVAEVGGDTEQNGSSYDESVIVKVIGGPGGDCEIKKRVGLNDKIWMDYRMWIHDDSKAGKPGELIQTSRTSKSVTNKKQPMKYVVTLKTGGTEGLFRGVQGLCIGQQALIDVQPEAAFGSVGRYFGVKVVPAGTRLKYYVDIMDIEKHEESFKRSKRAILRQREIMKYDQFTYIDTDGNYYITLTEFTEYFAEVDKVVPAGLWDKEDKDKNGVITWDEFSGTKGEDASVAEKATEALRDENEGVVAIAKKKTMEGLWDKVLLIKDLIGIEASENITRVLLKTHKTDLESRGLWEMADNLRFSADFNYDGIVTDKEIEVEFDSYYESQKMRQLNLEL